MKTKIFQILILMVLVGVFSVGQLLAEVPDNPPADNLPFPLNIDENPTGDLLGFQSKTGPFVLGAGNVNTALSVVYGRTGFGTVSPDAPVFVDGDIMIQDGSEILGDSNFLVSDDSGFAHWEAMELPTGEDNIISPVSGSVVLFDLVECPDGWSHVPSDYDSSAASPSGTVLRYCVKN